MIAHLRCSIFGKKYYHNVATAQHRGNARGDKNLDVYLIFAHECLSGTPRSSVYLFKCVCVLDSNYTAHTTASPLITLSKP